MVAVGKDRTGKRRRGEDEKKLEVKNAERMSILDG
jgi:hypothetical protein